jgi:hypothetical protein
MTPAVAFLIFNRPETTRRIFAAIRAARPPRLLVVADGPRADRPGEAARCAETRAIIDGVDWPCVVERNFAPENLGCRTRVASGLDWVFSKVEEAIILEDDCLPHPDFFTFCAELLRRYRDDPQIMAVCGNNFHPHLPTAASYHFSKYCWIWGWATWRRAWQHYDVAMSDWRRTRSLGWPEDSFLNRHEREYWSDCFDLVAHQGFSTWDYQWIHTCWRHQGLCAIPARNLVSNIGFGADATHTVHADERAALPTVALGPIVHPPTVKRHTVADRHDFEWVYGGRKRYRHVRLARWALRPWRAAKRRLKGWLVR